MGFTAILLATMCATSVAYHTTNASAGLVPAERTIARKLAVEGVPKLGEVSPTLFRGAQPTRQGFQKLAEMGIIIVVDLRERGREGERRQVTKLGMLFVEIPWNCFHPKDTDIARFLRLLRDNRGKKVFVHCQTGDDRTGMMVAAYRIAEQGNVTVCYGTRSTARSQPNRVGSRAFFRSSLQKLHDLPPL